MSPHSFVAGIWCQDQQFCLFSILMVYDLMHDSIIPSGVLLIYDGVRSGIFNIRILPRRW